MPSMKGIRWMKLALRLSSASSIAVLVVFLRSSLLARSMRFRQSSLVVSGFSVWEVEKKGQNVGLGYTRFGLLNPLGAC